MSSIFTSFFVASSTFLSDIFSCFRSISLRRVITAENEVDFKFSNDDGSVAFLGVIFLEFRAPAVVGLGSQSFDSPHANQGKWTTDLKDKRISFLSGLFGAFKEEIHTDIQLKPGDDGPCIPAHRVLLATRSEIFKKMLDSDGFKAPPSHTINLPELNYEELESLLEFLYSGSLPLEKLEKHVYPLFIVAEKYEIPYLQEFCQCHMLNSLNASSVLDVLETSEVCLNKGLKEIALNFIFSNTEDVVLSDKYEALATKNPQLCMQITREFFMNARNEKISRMGFQKKMGLQEKSCKKFQTKAGEGKMGNSQEFEESHA